MFQYVKISCQVLFMPDFYSKYYFKYESSQKVLSK